MSTTLIVLLIVLVLLVLAIGFVIARRRGRAGGVLAQRPRTTRDRSASSQPDPDDRSDVA